MPSSNSNISEVSPKVKSRKTDFKKKNDRKIAKSLEEPENPEQECPGKHADASVAKKAAKAAKKQAKIDALQTNVPAAETGNLKKSKKRKSQDDDEEDIAKEKRRKTTKQHADIEAMPLGENTSLEDGKNKTKKKKSKKQRDEPTAKTGIVSEASRTDEDAARKERKKLRKLRKEQEALAANAGQGQQNAEPVLAESKNTKHKREEQAKESGKRGVASSGFDASQKTNADTADKKHVASADQWNPDALSGDATRKNKFLRLLGAGKAGLDTKVNSERSSKQATDKDIRRVESELERQFEAGIRMKHDGQGKRRGLGA